MTDGRLRNPLLRCVAQCLMRLVEARTCAAALDALAGFLQDLPLNWYSIDVFEAGRIRKRLASHRCPRGFAPFVIRVGFLSRQDGTYQGTFGDSTLLVVKAASRSVEDQSLVCAAGLEKISPLNDGSVLGCIGALIHESLTRAVMFESDARRGATLEALLDHDDVIAVFDAAGRLVEQHSVTGRAISLTPAFLEAPAQPRAQRSRSRQPAAVALDGVLTSARSQWLAPEHPLDNRYLLVHARPPSAVPLSVVDRLRTFGLSRRESQVAELVFAGRTNQVIAQKLFISRDTVKTHCRRIFGKLGISRRTEFLRVLAAPSPEMGVAEPGLEPRT